MTQVLFEQRNPYKGSPPRPWVRLRLEAADGSLQEIELLADTGNPFALIIDQASMGSFSKIPLNGVWVVDN
jgi:hypothetical protein